MRLPIGWAETRLGEIAEFNPRGFDNDPADEDMLSFVPMASVEAESGIMDSRVRVRWGDVKKKGYVRFQDDDVLFAKITPCMENGKFAVAYGLASGRAVGSTEFHVIRPSSTIFSRFLLYSLLQVSLRRDARLHMQGAAGQMRVPLRILRDLSIALPPLTEQRRIVAALEERISRLDAAVAGLQRLKVLITRYRAAVLKAAFEAKLVETEDDLAIRESRAASKAHDWMEGLAEGQLDWRESPLGGWIDVAALDLALDAGYGTSEKCDYDGEGPPVLRIPNVDSGRIDFGDMKHARSSEGLGSTAISPGDLLIIRTNGSRGLIGRGAVVMIEPQPPHYFASYLIRLRLRPDPVLWRWVNLWWNSPGARGALTAMAATSAGQYNISLGKLERLRIPLPPRPEAERIIADVERRMSIADAVEREVNAGITRAVDLRQSILKRAFEGSLVPQDPNDEPASLLLERVRASRSETRVRAKRIKRPA